MNSNFDYFVSLGKANATGKSDLWTSEMSHFLQMIQSGQAFEAIASAYYYGVGRGCAKTERNAKKKNRRNRKATKNNQSNRSE